MELPTFDDIRAAERKAKELASTSKQNLAVSAATGVRTEDAHAGPDRSLFFRSPPCASWDGYQFMGRGHDRPRLWLVTDSSVPSGLGEHLLLLAKSLQLHFDVTVAAPHESGLVERAVQLGLAGDVFDAEQPRLLERMLARDCPDLVHIHAGIAWEGHALARAGRCAGVPVVVRTDHLPFLITDPDQQREFRRALMNVDRLICVSSAAAQTYRAAGIEIPISVVRNGVAAWSAKERATTRKVLAVGDGLLALMAGRFTDQKGHDLLLAAWPTVLEAHPRAILLLSGDGPLFERVAEQVKASGLMTSVKLLGHRSDVRDLMAAADILVLPSRFEGLPLVVLEAMAGGLPVIGADVPGIREAVVDEITGRLFASGDVEQLGHAIAASFADKPWRLRAAAAALKLYKWRFRAERMVDETLAVYRRAGVTLPQAWEIA